MSLLKCPLLVVCNW